MEPNDLRIIIYEQMQTKGSPLLWVDELREYMHQRGADHRGLSDEFFEHETQRGFLVRYQEGYKITTQGIAVYRKISGAPAREDNAKRIKRVFATVDEGEGLSSKQVAEILGISESAAQSNINKLLDAGNLIVLHDGRPRTFTLAGQKHLF